MRVETPRRKRYHKVITHASTCGEIYFKVNERHPARMGSIELENEKRAWLMRLIKKHCPGKDGKGNKAEFARETRIDASYLNRMLWPLGREGRKGLGEEQLKKILARYPDSGMPEGMKVYSANDPVPSMASATDQNDVIALQLIVDELVRTMVANAPGEARQFSALLKARADELHFSTETAGFVRSVLRTVELGQHIAAGAAERALRQGADNAAKPETSGRTRRKAS